MVTHVLNSAIESLTHQAVRILKSDLVKVVEFNARIYKESENVKKTREVFSKGHVDTVTFQFVSTDAVQTVATGSITFKKGRKKWN